MPIFSYKAKNEHSDTVKGKVEANNQAQAIALLKERNLFVISLQSQNQTSFGAINQFLSSVKKNEIVNLTRQLSTMVNAGLSLSDGLRILQQQSRPAMAKLVDEITRDIEGGMSFAKALEKHPANFSKVYVQLVRAGEAGGVLDEILERLAENLEKQKDFQGKTRGALIYPAIVLSALVIVAGVMMIFVIPKLSEMYEDFGADLPLATQLLIDVSTLVARFWWLMLAAVAGGFFALRAWRQTERGRLTTDGWLLKMPIFGKLRQKVMLTDFARTLALLLSAGISLLQALDIVTGAVPNAVYQKAFGDATKQVEKGVSFAQSIQSHTIFPPIFPQMISVGEETGKLDEVLLKLSLYFQSESEQAIKNLTTALEPFIMIVLGLGVALMVVAIIMPIYNLTSQF